MIQAFPDLTTTLQIYIILQMASCEAERNFPNYQQQKTNFDQPGWRKD
jgi:hypothetical protein